MPHKQKGQLRQEKSINESGHILKISKVPILKEKDYFVKNFQLDGDAPKQFIKAYFFQKRSGVRKDRPKSWAGYIAKSAEKWYPHESVIEYLINRIGNVIGLEMNEVALRRVNGQIRFLSKYFRSENERLIHVAEICGDYLSDQALAKEIADNRSDSRSLFTFDFSSVRDI